MEVKELNKSLIGKRVSCIFTGLKVTGTIIYLVEEKYTRGIGVKFDTPQNWGDEIYTTTENTESLCTGKGSLQYAELI